MRKIILFIAAFLASSLYAAVDWPPVNPADLAVKQSRVEKDADAEVMLWEVRLLDETNGGEIRTVQNHYVRLKIFTDRGRDKYSTVDISFGNHMRISDVAGRSIKPNGEIVELKKDSVYERVLARAGGVKVKVKSFAMPAVETGGIIEYRWKETLDDQLSNYVRLQFSRDIPVQQVKYILKPLSLPGFNYGMRGLSFNLKQIPFAKEPNGFVSITATDIPAFHEEPDMPAEAKVRPWMLVYYAPDSKDSPEKYWDKFGKETYNNYKSQIKINDEMRAAASEVVSGAKSPEEKAQKLYEYVHKTFKNIYYSPEISAQDRERMKKNNNTSDTFKQKAGSAHQIALLFIALATALDFDARLTAAADRDNGTFEPRLADPYFLSTYNVAVKLGEKWVFCDPGTQFLPFGMLRWQEEGEAAMVADPKQPAFSMTPVASPETSLAERKGTFKLNETGELEGDVQLRYSGHSAVTRKWTYREQSAAEREESVKQQVKDRFSLAEVSEIKLENEQDPVKPLTLSYHVKVPGYAQHTGRRLFLKAAYFHRDFSPRYSSSAERKFPVEYSHAWSEHDVITIELPEGYAIEKGEAPAPFDVGVGKYQTKMSVVGGKTLTYDRIFYMGKEGRLRFQREAFDTLKKAFDALQEGDDHQLVLLRQGQ